MGAKESALREIAAKLLSHTYPVAEHSKVNRILICRLISPFRCTPK